VCTQIGVSEDPIPCLSATYAASPHRRSPCEKPPTMMCSEEMPLSISAEMRDSTYLRELYGETQGTVIRGIFTIALMVQDIECSILLQADHMQTEAHRIDSLRPSSSSRSLILSREVRSNQPGILMPMFSVMDLCRVCIPSRVV
jgi:hypothetical protein